MLSETRFTFLSVALTALLCIGANAATRPGGFGDSSPSVIYDVTTGRLSLEDGWLRQASAIEISSASGRFVGPKPEFIGQPFDVFSESKIFMLRPGVCIPDGLDFGAMLPVGLSQEFLLDDLTISSSGCGPWETSYDLIYVPEPMVPLGEFALLLLAGRRWTG